MYLYYRLDVRMCFNCSLLEKLNEKRASNCFIKVLNFGDLQINCFNGKLYSAVADDYVGLRLIFVC